jgi:hypothetical protein
LIGSRYLIHLVILAKKNGTICKDDIWKWNTEKVSPKAGLGDLNSPTFKLLKIHTLADTKIQSPVTREIFC